MTSHLIDLDAAIVAALKAHGGLTALVAAASVYGSVPSAAARPYVVVGDTTTIDASSRTIDAEEHTVTIHVWSRPPSTTSAAQATSSKRQCLLIMAQVRAALHEADLTLDAGVCVNIRCEFQETFRDPDDASHHGVVRFRAVTHD